MSKIIKFAITLITSIIFLTACSTTSSNEDSNWNSEPKQEVKEQSIELEEKINNKQKYVVIQKYIYDGSHRPDKTEKFIEEKANFMYSKNYTLVQQNITSDKYGDINDVILTFEYKGD